MFKFMNLGLLYYINNSLFSLYIIQYKILLTLYGKQINPSHSLLLMWFSYTSVSSTSLAYAINGSYMSTLHTYPWESSPHIYIQWSLAPHHDLAPLTILFCGPFSKIIFVGPRGLPCPQSNCGKNLKHLATFAIHHHRF